MKTYLVGGAVRDELLGVPIKDRDWVVVGATGPELVEQGYRQVGKGFPVYLHPDSGEEYALARKESKVAPGHTGFEFDTSAEVSLEEDLLRRDLTINAMARDERGELVDPYGGQKDLDKRVLRHVSPAFSEDPLRVLRVARFAARLQPWGFTVASETLQLMRSISESGELETLVAERVWGEFELAMASPAPRVFVEILRECDALAILLPEVNRLFGVPQPPKYHPEVDTGLHTLMCLDQAANLSDDPVVRYAVLMHDVGKGVTDPEKWPSHYGHEALGLPLQDDVARRMKVPNSYAGLARLVCEHHTLLHRVQELRPRTVLKLMESLDAFRRPERLEKFLDACEADARGRTGLEDRAYPQRAYLLGLLAAVSALDIKSLLGDHPGKPPEQVIREQRLLLLNDAMDKAA